MNDNVVTETVLVNIKTKGGAETISITPLSNFIKKYKNIVNLEDMDRLISGKRIVKIFSDHIWLAELSVESLW